MLHIAVCEDETFWMEQLLALLQKLNRNHEWDIDAFYSGADLLSGYFYARYDLIFMDIYMADMNGIDTITAIRDIDPDVLIAFTTTSTDYALEGYRLKVMKYIEKPVQEQDILETISLARLMKSSRRLITLSIGRKKSSFAADQISCLEQKNYSVLLHQTDGTTLTFTRKLDEMQSICPMPPFYRCHKSFLVNLSQVLKLDAEMRVFTMKGGFCAYIRRGSVKEAQQTLDEYRLNLLRRS